MSAIVKCLVVQQPWAWALVAGVKDVENRTWDTNYRGPIAIQASASKTIVNQVVNASETELPPNEISYGAIIGVVDLIDVLPLSEKLESNPWAWGPYCWKVGNARIFKKAIPAKGKLKLFSLDPALAKLVDFASRYADVPAPSANTDVWVRAIRRFEGDARNRHLALIESYYELEDGPNMLRLAGQGLKRWGDLDAEIQYGVALLLNGDPNGALRVLDRAIHLYPASAEAYMLRGGIYEELGMQELANSDFAKAKEIDPDCDAAERVEDNDDAR